ncbi:TauD/TfdA family dioxygenase [Sphaerimonospora thailandensis]|uniref:TauD/TfdA family dioxygenase n=1 Tax=Sphaerimonospora thailandensis TaxID=795644 RepID=UPI00195261AF
MRLLTPMGRQLTAVEARRWLAVHGIVLVAEATVAELTSFLGDWTVPYSHPHESSPGITVIQPLAVSDGNGNGFTRRSLPLHTDRAHSPAPPTIVGCLYTQPSSKGGESLLLDGAEIVRAAERSTLVSEARHVVLRSRGRPWLPVISSSTDSKRYRIRYRSDQMAQPHAATVGAQPLLTMMQGALTTPAVHLFEEGQGYLIHNQRFLHGRRTFTGNREAIRIMAVVMGSSAHSHMNTGFELTNDRSDQLQG